MDEGEYLNYNLKDCSLSICFDNYNFQCSHLNEVLNNLTIQFHNLVYSPYQAN